MYKYSDDVILRLSDGAYIPKDPENRDYAEYLAWVESGGVTLPEFTDEELASQKLLLDTSIETVWRAAELLIVARQLEAIKEDEADEAPPDLMPGTRKQWLKYRGQVSNWKEGAGSFPDIAQRPVRLS
ncbi:hypothetical protein [Pseudomonas sp. ZS1P83]